MAVEEPVIDRAAEQIERDFDLGVGRDLAALDRTCGTRRKLRRYFTQRYQREEAGWFGSDGAMRWQWPCSSV
jgi:hypothetical protein